MPTNDFLPFCPVDTGTNLLSESDYTAALARTNGVQPGIASSKLFNKGLRQATYITGQFAQYLANQCGADILDDNTPAKLLAQVNAVLARYTPAITKYVTPGTTTWNMLYVFEIASGSANSGATYTNNAVTFTVDQTVATGVVLKARGAGSPAVSGTLTRTGGVGDPTITFYAFRKPLYLLVRAIGGGGGGAGAGNSGTSPGGVGGNGADSTFGGTVVVGSAGLGGGVIGPGGAGGAASLSGATGVSVPGSGGNPGSAAASTPGGAGGTSFFGGAGLAGYPSGVGGVAGGAGGGYGSGGGGSSAGSAGNQSGAGGGAGGYAEGVVAAPNSTYTCVVGAGGTAGVSGTGGQVGGAGSSGLVEITEFYQ